MKRGRTPRGLLVALDRVTLAMSRDVSIAAPEMLTFAGMQHMERTQSIFSDGNIVGAGIAEKRSEGRALGDLGLVFYVRKKQALKDLDPRLAVPPIVVGGGGKAVFTDVVEVGEIVPEAQLNAGPPPLQSGFSISHLNGSAGTLGAFVRKGSRTFVLSNAHVLAQSGAAVVGDSILYPGKADGGAAPGSSIGRLETFTHWQPGKAFLNEADAALAEIAVPHLASLVAGIPGANLPIKIGDPVRGMKVIKRGRTSGDTESTVHDIDAKILVEYPGVGTVGFYGQSRCDRYTSAGDSGAIVVDKDTGAVVGLHFAAAGPSSFFTPIRTVMRALRFQF